MYSVLEGEMRARAFRGGREVTILTLGAGETFGELALLIEGRRATDIVANENSTLLKLPAKAFAQITGEAPAPATPFLLAISRMLAHRARVLGGRAAGVPWSARPRPGFGRRPRRTSTGARSSGQIRCLRSAVPASESLSGKAEPQA
jgi:CRP-like cAMP-binding protein